MRKFNIGDYVFWNYEGDCYLARVCGVKNDYTYEIEMDVVKNYRTNEHGFETYEVDYSELCSPKITKERNESYKIYPSVMA